MNDEKMVKEKMHLEDVDVSNLCAEIRKHASEARNEEELKIRIESTLRLILDRWGIKWASYEHSHKISGVRKDALYGTVIIEYKAPQKLDSKRDFEKGKEQVKRYISEEAGDPQYFGRYFGILLDGYKIAFIRYRKNEWEDPDLPLEISPRTVLRILEAIRGLKRKPIDAEELLIDFGPKSELSKNLILKLYRLIANPKSPRSLMLYEDWRRVFSQVCAYSKDKMVGLIDYYGLRGEENIDVEKLMFSVHTYYTLQMKLLTSEIVTLFADSLLGSYLKRIEEAYYKGSDDMLSELYDLEEGGIFSTVGIKNFLEADYFAWYLDEWGDELASHINGMVKKLLDYEPATVELSPERVRDLFKRLYQNLVPRDIRHRLGEYFTPDWLAELLLDEVGYYGEPDKSVLDPACGSGTFLVLAIKRIKDFAEEKFIDKRTLLEKIVENIKGIDLNPLAVQASKANYLIALSNLLRYRPRDGIEIPVYLADSIFVSRKKTVENEMEVYMKTTQGEFWIPHEVIDKDVLPHTLRLIENCARNRYSKEEFENFLIQEIKNLQRRSTDSVVRLYSKILSLEENGKNRIWVRLLKNSFAPLLIGRFDFVAGNPPWINWENLPQFYREETRELWDKYGLLEGTRGGMKRDMAMMFTARCLDRYVKENGRYGFLVPFTVFKTKSGTGFRKFLAEGKIISPDHKVPCKLVKIHDLVELCPFEGAVNRTAMFVIEKCWKTKFPIPCIMWHNPKTKGIPMNERLIDVEKTTKQFNMIMAPITRRKPETQWAIITENAYGILKKILKPSTYRAYAGTLTGMDGIYVIKIISRLHDNILLVENLGKTARKNIKKIRRPVEENLIYPVVRGRDAKKWYFKPVLNIIVPHDSKSGKVLGELEMKMTYENIHGYFSYFKKILEKRTIKPFLGKKRSSYPYYMLDNTGSRTFSMYKVGWKHISGKISGKANFEAFVLSPREKDEKLPIPTHGLIYIPSESIDEAHYICSILNSSISSLIVTSYALEVHITTDVPKYVYIPQYAPQDPLHQNLSELSKKAHNFAKKIYEENRKDLEIDLKKIEDDIDEAVTELYSITDNEFKEIKKALMILKKGEIPEEDDQEEKMGTVVPSSVESVSMKVEPLLIEEKSPTEISVTIMNNTDDGIRNIKLTSYLQNDKVCEQIIKKIRTKTSESILFSLPALTAGEFDMRFSVDYTVGKDKRSLSHKRTLYVKKGKEKKKKKAEFDKELEDLFR